LVLIPGFGSGAWSWKYQAESLAERFRVLTFDPRGVGASDIVEGSRASIEKIAEDVLELLDLNAIEKAHLLGISFGGFVAQHIAIHNPERVDRLVLASTSAGGPEHVPPEPEILESFVASANLEDREKIHMSQAFTTEFAASSAATVEEFCSELGRNPVRPGVHADQLRSALEFDSTSDLARISAPTLVLTGNRDTVVPAANSVKLAEAIPDARLQIVEGAGHMFFVESPALFNRAVTEFLLEK
jgi:pimeloyl-ACP methyl ester carboxylesterase